MDTPPALPENPPVAAPTGMAKASLVCGICGFILGPLASIPAIITGHIALGRIHKSGAPTSRRAIAGLALGYTVTALSLPIIMGFIVGNRTLDRARGISALATATSIEVAVNSYFAEYGTMPAEGDVDVVIRTDQDTAFLEALLGTNPEISPRGIRFLVLKEARGEKKDGLFFSADGRIIGLYDPWGNGYRVHLDLDYDETLVVNAATGETLTGRRVAVTSDGPDKKPNTADDIRTW